MKNTSSTSQYIREFNYVLKSVQEGLKTCKLYSYTINNGKLQIQENK